MEYLNLNTDTTLGGENASNYKVPSQLAIKTYVDNNSGGGSTNEIPAGTVINIPTDYSTLSEAFASLNGKYSTGNVFIKFTSNAFPSTAPYSLSSTETMNYINCNIPQIIINGNNNYFYLTGGTLFWEFLSGNSTRTETPMNVSIRGCKFVNSTGNNGCSAIKMEGLSFDATVTSNTFTDFNSKALNFNKVKCARVTKNTFSNTLSNYGSGVWTFVAAENGTYLYCDQNSFSNSGTSSSSSLLAIRAYRGSTAISRQDTFQLQQIDYCIQLNTGCQGTLASPQVTSGQPFGFKTNSSINGLALSENLQSYTVADTVYLPYTYTKASAAAAILNSDTVDTALGKLEYKIDQVDTQLQALVTTLNNVTTSQNTNPDYNGSQD